MDKEIRACCDRCEQEYLKKYLTSFEDSEGELLLVLCPICEPGRNEQLLHEEETEVGKYLIYVREREDSVDDDHFIYYENLEGYTYLIEIKSTIEECTEVIDAHQLKESER